MAVGRPFQPGKSGNPNGRPRGVPTFASLRRLLATSKDAEFIRDQLKDIAEHAEDPEQRRLAALDLAKFRGDSLEPVSAEDDDGEDLTPDELAAALMPQEAKQ